MRLGEFVYGRKRFQPLFHRLHNLALDGLNYGCADPRLNGEYALLDRLASGWEQPVIFDVGAFEGDWSAAVLTRSPNATIYAFEPNPAAHEHIRRRLGDSVALHRLALGAEPGAGELFAPAERPEMASLLVRDLRHVGQTVAPLDTVTVSTIDTFCAEHDIGHIDLLKLDVEGHELAVLQGARRLLDGAAVDAVQFEFGGTALDSKVFLRDFLDVLDGYRVYRIVRDGVDPVRYTERAEVFTFSNFLALRSGLSSTQA